MSMVNYILKPKTVNVLEFGKNDKKLRDRCKKNFDVRRGTKFLPGYKVFIPEISRMRRVREDTKYPRSVVVNTDMGPDRRNGQQLIKVRYSSKEQEKVSNSQQRKLKNHRSRYT